jgi:hypothetical protein
MLSFSRTCGPAVFFGIFMSYTVSHTPVHVNVLAKDSMCWPKTNVDIDMYRFKSYGWTVKDTRLIALIERKQMKALKAAAKREGVSLGEVVRRAITRYLKAVK